MSVKDIKIEFIETDKLKPYKNNARKHSKKQIQQITNSINKFGFNVPILVDSDNQIIAGHGRCEAAKKLGLHKVPTILIDHLTESQKKAFIIADNKIAENADWDMEMLSVELAEISMSTEFDIELTGFEMAEIDLILDVSNEDEVDPADEIPEVDESPAITKSGDIWNLGEHKVICGDSLKSETYNKLMDGKTADMVCTDPPYNVKIDGHVCGNGKIKHSEFPMASGELSITEFGNFLGITCDNAKKFSKDGSLHYLFMDWRHIDILLAAGKSVYTELKNICIWNKDNGGMGSLYRSKHEMIAVFKNGTKPHINNIELGKHGRYRTNVWDYKGVNSFGRNQKDLELHPTVKPVAMIADAIKDCTKLGDIVLDPFAGSGSTLMAAEKTRRIARCIELDPKYCDVIIRRWQELTGEQAWHDDKFVTFNELSGEKNDN